MRHGIIGGLIATVLGWLITLGFVIGGIAWISGNLGNSDNIGGTIGDIGGAGVFGGVLGGDGLVSHARDQQQKFSQVPLGDSPAVKATTRRQKDIAYVNCLEKAKGKAAQKACKKP